MKVSELSGRLLDAWVARAEGHNVATIKQGSEVVGYQLYFYSGDTPRLPDYSTDWADGGPIMERERISTHANNSGTWNAGIPATRDNGYEYWAHCQYSAPTPLIAAMRTFVTSKFGEEVPGEV